VPAKSRWSARRVVLGLILGVPFALFAAPAAGASAALLMSAPLSGSATSATPTFSGSTEDNEDAVTVVVHEGASSAGPIAQTLAPVPASGGLWSAAAASLPEGTYTAVAEQTESADMDQTSFSNAVTFEVVTKPPSVTLEAPKSPSKDTTPSFKGASSEAGEVTVDIYAGSTASGSPVSTAVAHASGAGEWSSGAASPALAGGEYTAAAVQESNLGNGPGTSNAVSFVVDTKSPTVTLDPVPTPSHQTEPSFAGTASEAGEVTVHVHKGSASGSEVASVTVAVAGGEWSSPALSSALADGEYAAVATEPSSLGNGEGRSSAVIFDVDTAPPTVTLAGPPTRSKDTTPSFEGTASEAGEVTVHVHKGSASGSEVAHVTFAVSEGSWSSPAVSPGLAEGEYTAVATEPSALGNGEGTSKAVTFEVVTSPPSVSLEAPASPSKNTKPSFKGTTSEGGEVKVEVHAGSTVAGAVVATAVAHPSAAGEWSSGAASPALVTGEYTAVAVQDSALGNGLGTSEPATFKVDTESPKVSLEGPPALSSDKTPSFKGTASEASTVTVHVFKGSKASGTEAASVEAQASGGVWASPAIGSALADGEYTAVADEQSSLGNAPGVSNTVTFSVDTKVPTVTLAAPASPSRNTTPSFSGSTSEAGEVKVEVHAGSVTGTVVATAVAHPSAAGEWSSGAASPALASGEYTAVAAQESALGNGPGTSKPVTFVVDTVPPSVVLEAPASPSKNTKPSFKGTTSEGGEVKVEVHAGSTVAGAVVATAVAHPSAAGEWSSGAASPALATGEYTAVAVQESALGNGPGTSKPVTFAVDTEPPKVSLEGPPALSRDNTPSFKGTASEAGTVTVHVHEGASVGGSEVAKVTATVSGGKWSATVGSALADGQYTAVATEPSSLGNEPGTSGSVTFEVDTAPPTVTLLAPPARSKNTTPSFEGTTSEAGEVKVAVYAGASATGTPVSTAIAHAAGNSGWTSGTASPALAAGEYTAVATQESALGNGPGTSKPVTFEVVTSPPVVKLEQPKSPSNQTKPQFKGTTSEAGEVKVSIYPGPTATGTPVATATAHPAGAGGWTSTATSQALTSGQYTAVAVQESALGNGPGTSTAQTFEVNTEPPRVTLNQLASPSKVTTPRFSGTASEAGEVTVHVFKGAEASGTEVATVKGTVKGGSWESAEVSSALAEGEYTALASEPSALGNSPGTSSAMTFKVVTKSPTVTLEQPESPSNVTTPSFGGEASADTEVVVHIYAGTKAQGTPVATATATVSAGTWHSGPASPALNGEDRTYAAVAEQASPLGNPPGKSGVVSFVVNTNPPTVSLERPESPSKDTTPKFEGSASETMPVTVHIYAGPKAQGSEVAKAAATVTGGKWKSEAASPALADGEYTAVATQPSSLGNNPGTSPPVTFEVDTKPPTVTLNQPETPSKNTTPTFTGTASASTQVVIHIFEGATTHGTERATATASGNGANWKSSAASPALAGGDRTYTAVAEQSSPLGNPAGVSSPVTFVVDTEPPKVTLSQPPSPSKNRTPTFKGTGSDTTLVTVHIYAGSKPEGAEVASATASGTGSAWESKAASPQLADGEYTALATQPSSLGNEPGTSSPVSFVVDTESPKVTLEQPPTPSGDRTPTFKGTASAETQVVVHIYEGTKAEGTEVESVTTTPVAGVFSSENESPLAPGEHTYTAVAEQASPLGNPPGLSKPVTFAVDTEGPKVTLETPETPSNNTKPSFKGTTNAETKVVVHIYEGTEAKGTEVTSVTATPSKGAWSSAPATLKSGEHTYTAIATEASPITNNPEGTSKPVTFVIDTEAPKISLETPETPSNVTKPTFSGATNASTSVVVHIYEGSKAQGKEVAEVTGKASEGRWTAGPVALLAGNHTYSAVATQASPFAGVESGTSNAVTFVIDTEAPKVSLEPLETPSSNTKPTFKGTTNAETQVVVHVFEGTEAKGTEVTSAIGTPNGKGGWSAAVSLPGGEHTYTAIAKQVSPIANNPEGESSTITFVLDTEPPKLTFEAPETPSNNDAPTFAGTTNATTSLVVHVYEGTAPEGTEVTKVTATVSAGKWSAKAALPTTGEHTYTAIAMQPSPFNGIGEGKSKPVTFFVDREAPKITLNSVPRSSVSSPTFSGTTNATTEVLVHLFEGPKAEGKEIASIKATATEGKWTSKAASLASTGEHTYSAFATQVSPFSGNSEGKTAPITFIVDHNPPTVTLNGPKSPTGNSKPSFSGTASEKQPVTLKIYSGSQVEGAPLVTKTANVENGSWKIGEVLLSSGRHTYTAVASEPSEIGNSAGESAHATFEIDTESPIVTLSPVAEVSSNQTPSFSGTASDTPTVTVKIYSGTNTKTTPVRELKAQPSGETWSSPAVNPKLENGKYTAVAYQPSSIEDDPEGESPAVRFEINTEAPAVTLNKPAPRSSKTEMSFSGTASSTTPVTVEIFKGEGTGGLPFKEVEVAVKNSSWTSGEVALESAEGGQIYTAVAVETNTLKIAGRSAPATFTIYTEPPKITLTGPPSPSNDLTPRLSGTTNEGTQVTVEIYEGTAALGSPVSTATATPSEGQWSVSGEKPLPEGLHTFTAIAKQPSAIGNLPGASNDVTFTVDTLSPAVTLGPVSSEGDAKPFFSGTASESGTVTVDLYAGAVPSGTVVAAVTAAAAGGEWTSGQLKEALANGEYTAIATQPSALGNAPGASAPVSFTVNTSPPSVSVQTPSAVKNTSALLNASVNPNGGNVGLCAFEFGTTTAYGTSVECAFSSAGDSECTFTSCSFPAGADTVAVYARIFELKPSTTYFYRVAAENERGSGSAVGSFTTSARAPVSSGAPGPAQAAPSAPSAASGVAASRSASIAAAIAKQLAPSGRSAKIAALFKAGFYGLRLKALEAGTAVVRWYYLPHGAKLGGKGKHAPVLVASGTVKFRSAGTATVKLRLTLTGRRLLAHARQLRLTATCVFTPVGSAAITAVKAFELKR
jgi:hypothetical protein